MEYEALIFDLDDTLVDFTDSEKKSLDHVYGMFFQDIVTDKIHFENEYHFVNRLCWDAVEEDRMPISMVGFQRFKYLCISLAVKLDPTQIAKEYESSLAKYVSWFPGVEDSVRSLKGSHRLGIITNGFKSIQENKKKNMNLDEFFESFIISEAVGISKPKKEIFDLALSEMNLSKSKVLMIGDSYSSDYQGAINAGIDFCFVTNKRPLPKSSLPTPKYVIDSVNELALILQRELVSA
ncbi:MAG: YjjG family noncanonical pyrimidine nucleotidase [Chlamydiales bacterium]|jgi:YjjG family noncanonical pyrimidine nucleotidase